MRLAPFSCLMSYISCLFKQDGLNHLFKHRLRLFCAAGNTAAHGRFAIFGYPQECGDTLNLKCAGKILLLIGVYFVYHNLAFVLEGQFFQDWRCLSARRTPVGIKIDDTG